jgi:hypothetical protein
MGVLRLVAKPWAAQHVSVLRGSRHNRRQPFADTLNTPVRGPTIFHLGKMAWPCAGERCTHSFKLEQARLGSVGSPVICETIVRQAVIKPLWLT